MTAKCPKDANHRKFKTMAVVMETWVVDENGNYIETARHDAKCMCGPMEVVFGPLAGNKWTCAECATEAKVTGV
jgi:hypothetical protein